MRLTLLISLSAISLGSAFALPTTQQLKHCWDTLRRGNNDTHFNLTVHELFMQSATDDRAHALAVPGAHLGSGGRRQEGILFFDHSGRLPPEFIACPSGIPDASQAVQSRQPDSEARRYFRDALRRAILHLAPNRQPPAPGPEQAMRDYLERSARSYMRTYREPDTRLVERMRNMADEILEGLTACLPLDGDDDRSVERTLNSLRHIRSTLATGVTRSTGNPGMRSEDAH